MSLNTMMDEFIKRYGLTTKPINADNVVYAAELAEDEVVEAMVETYAKEFNQHDGIKELLDIVYVTTQKLREMGVDVDQGLALVHKSNMSKLVFVDEEGGALALEAEVEAAKLRYPDVEVQTVAEAGYFRLYSPSVQKVVKPTCYVPADITSALPN